VLFIYQLNFDKFPVIFCWLNDYLGGVCVAPIVDMLRNLLIKDFVINRQSAHSYRLFLPIWPVHWAHSPQRFNAALLLLRPIIPVRLQLSAGLVSYFNTGRALAGCIGRLLGWCI